MMSKCHMAAVFGPSHPPPLGLMASWFLFPHITAKHAKPPHAPQLISWAAVCFQQNPRTKKRK